MRIETEVVWVVVADGQIVVCSSPRAVDQFLRTKKASVQDAAIIHKRSVRKAR